MLVNRKRWLLVSVLVLAALVLAACQPANGENGAQPTDALGTEPGLMETAPLATEPLATEPLATEPMATEPMATEPVPQTGAEPSVTVQDQALEDGSVSVEEVVSDGPGWMVIHADDNGSPGPVIGHSAVQDGSNSDVVVEIDESQATETLHAMLHTDVGEVGTYEFPGADVPVMVDGQMVSPTFMVSGLAAGEGAMPADGLAEGQESLEVSSSPDLGEYLVDADGMTLYWFANDEPGVSNCSGGCLEAWPPFLVESEEDIQVGEGIDESLVGTIPFEGGMLVTYDEMPLYYWQNDQEPGDTTGHGVNDVWFVVPPEGIDPSMPGSSSATDESSSSGAY